MRRWLAIAGVMVVLSWPTARPAEAQVVVGAVRSADAALDVVRYVATLANREDVAKQLEPFIKTLTGGKGLAGIDLQAPFGFYIGQLSPDLKQLPEGAIFIPVSNEKDFLELLKALDIQLDEPDAQRIRGITLQTGQKLYLRFAHRYAFVGVEHAHLARNLPNPGRFFTQEQLRRLVIVSLRAREISPPVRKKFLEFARQAMSAPVEREPGVPDELFQLLLDLNQIQRKDVLQFLEDLEEVTLTADLEKETHRLTVDFDFVFRPGSSNAKQAQQLQSVPSLFRVLQAEQSSGMLEAHPIDQNMREILNKLSAFLEKSIAKASQEKQAVLRKLHASILPTLRTDLLELGLFFYGPAKDEKFTPLLAIRLREGKKLEKALRELVEILPEDIRKRVGFDVAKYAGHGIHQVDISIGDADLDRHFANFLGEQKLTVLITDEYLLVSAGTHGLATVQQAAASIKGEQAGPAFILEFPLRQIGALARRLPDGENFAKAVSQTFTGQQKSLDRFRVVQTAKDNTVRVRLELPTLLIRAIILTAGE